MSLKEGKKVEIEGVEGEIVRVMNDGYCLIDFGNDETNYLAHKSEVE